MFQLCQPRFKRFLPREHMRCRSWESYFCPSVRPPSVCLSVCHNHFATLIPTVVGGRRPLPSEICPQNDPPPFEKRRLRPISAHNVSTVGDSKKSSITTNIKSTTGFPTSHRWSAYVTPKCPKGWLKKRFFSFFVYKATGDRLRRCQLSSPACVLNI